MTGEGAVTYWAVQWAASRGVAGGVVWYGVNPDVLGPDLYHALYKPYWQHGVHGFDSEKNARTGMRDIARVESYRHYRLRVVKITETRIVESIVERAATPTLMERMMMTNSHSRTGSRARRRPSRGQRGDQRRQATMRRRKMSTRGKDGK